MHIKKYKRINYNYILAIAIFFSTFILDYICKKNNLVYRQWFSLSIIYYRYAFIITLLVILPCYIIIKKRSMWLKLLGYPIIAFIVFILLISMVWSRTLYTDSYYKEINGQRVIALEEHFWGNVRTIYYVPVNIFFMKRSPDLPYPY